MVKLLGGRGAAAVMGLFMLALGSSEASAQQIANINYNLKSAVNPATPIRRRSRSARRDPEFGRRHGHPGDRQDDECGDARQRQRRPGRAGAVGDPQDGVVDRDRGGLALSRRLAALCAGRQICFERAVGRRNQLPGDRRLF